MARILTTHPDSFDSHRTTNAPRVGGRSKCAPASLSTHRAQPGYPAYPTLTTGLRYTSAPGREQHGETGASPPA
jgi:hypothetical protein